MMKKQQAVKASTLLLTAALVLSACASNKSGGSDTGASPADNGGATAKKVKITYWTPFSGGDGDYMNAMVKAFNAENPNSGVCG